MFEHDAPDVVAAAAAATSESTPVTLSRRSLPPEMLCVATLGKRERPGSRELRQLRRMLKPQLEVRVHVVMGYLRWLKAVSPVYHDVVISDQSEGLVMDQMKIDQEVLAHAVVVDDAAAQSMERVLTSRVHGGTRSANTTPAVQSRADADARPRGSDGAAPVPIAAARTASTADGSVSRYLVPAAGVDATFSWLYGPLLAQALHIDYPAVRVTAAAGRLAAGDNLSQQAGLVDGSVAVPRGASVAFACRASCASRHTAASCCTCSSQERRCSHAPPSGSRRSSPRTTRSANTCLPSPAVALATPSTSTSAIKSD